MEKEKFQPNGQGIPQNTWDWSPKATAIKFVLTSKTMGKLMGKDTQEHYSVEVINRRKKHNTSALELLEKIALALERHDRTIIKKAVRKVVKIDPGSDAGTAPIFGPKVLGLSDLFFDNLMARLVFIDDYPSYRLIYLWRTKARSLLGTEADQTQSIWAEIVVLAAANVYRLPRLTEIDSSFKILERTLIAFDKEYSRGEVKKNVSGAVVEQQLKVLVISFHSILQRMFDTISNNINSSKHTLGLVKKLRSRYKKIVSLFDEHPLGRWAGDKEIDTSKYRLSKQGNFYLDYHAELSHRNNRPLKFTYYNEENSDFVTESRATKIRYTFRQRDRQIEFLEFLLDIGMTVPFELNTAELDMKHAIALLPKGSNLHSDETWIQLLTVVFTTHFLSNRSNNKKMSLEESAVSGWRVSVLVLKYYFETNTEHTKLNIRDSAPSYLKTAFPASISGRLLHDCGVYALRIVYILARFSKAIENKLRRLKPGLLRMSGEFVVLPFHVGLILRIDAGISLVTHNKEFQLLTDSKMKELEQEWMSADEFGNPKSNDGNTRLDQDQFLLDLASQFFIRRTDQPSKLSEINRLGANRSTLRKSLWRDYMENVIGRKGRIFNRTEILLGEEAFRIDLAYLELLEREREWFNISIVPFWNEEAIPAWMLYGPKLTALFNDYQKTIGRKKEDAEILFASMRAEYVDALLFGQPKKIDVKNKTKKDHLASKGLEYVRKQEKELDELRKFVLLALDKYDDIIAQGARRTHHRQVNVGKDKRYEVFDHIKEISRPIDQMKLLPIPPFDTKTAVVDPIPE